MGGSSVGTALSDPWKPCIYTQDVLDNGFDSHEPTYEPLKCMRGENGTVHFKGFVQCYNGATNCFFQLHWGLERVLTGVPLAVMPFECRPDEDQHILGSAGTDNRIVKLAVQRDGNVVLLSDGGLMSWFLQVDGVTSAGKWEPDHTPGTAPAEVAVLTPWTPPKRPQVAITIPMTSKKLGIASPEESPLMRIVLPSLMRALSTDLVKFNVVVYAGYDTSDEFWTNAQKMDRIFTTKVDMGDGAAEPAKGTLTLKWIQCDCDCMVCNTNCISRIAYRDGADYFFRSNDDTEFMTNIKSTHNWISSFVSVLSEYDPPNIGVVGPLCRQGNQEILTHDFVHRNHMDLFFQSYYPSLLSNWWCDDWITTVYGVQRTTKHEGVEVYHHTFVSRYEVDYTIHNSGDLVHVIDDGVGQIRAWLDQFLADSLVSHPSSRDSIAFFMEGLWPASIARRPDGPVLLVTPKPLVETPPAGALAAPVAGWSSDALQHGSLGGGGGGGGSSSKGAEQKEDTVATPPSSFTAAVEDGARLKAGNNANASEEKRESKKQMQEVEPEPEEPAAAAAAAANGNAGAGTNDDEEIKDFMKKEIQNEPAAGAFRSGAAPNAAAAAGSDLDSRDKGACVAQANDCHSCSSDGSTCAVCKNAAFLHEGICKAACPAGTTPDKLKGNFDKRCKIDPVLVDPTAEEAARGVFTEQAAARRGWKTNNAPPVTLEDAGDAVGGGGVALEAKAPPNVAGGAGGGGVALPLSEQLKMLWELAEDGILTKDEFVQKKQELLSRI